MLDQNNKTPAVTTPQSISGSKRALLKAAWVVPVVVAINLPVSSFAQNASGAQHGGTPTNGICQQQKDPGIFGSIFQLIGNILGIKC